MVMEFNKYRERGAYHWAEYKAQTIYGKHADEVKKWIRKGRTLDIGAGDGLITYLLNAEGTDNNELAVKLAQEKGVNVKLGSAYNLKMYKENIFDNVFMGDVIEHLELPARALCEVKRVLKENGYLYITTPPANENGTMHDRYHYREWTTDGLVEYLRLQGFILKEKPFIRNVRIYALFQKIGG